MSLYSISVWVETGRLSYMTKLHAAAIYGRWRTVFPYDIRLLLFWTETKRKVWRYQRGNHTIPLRLQLLKTETRSLSPT